MRSKRKITTELFANNMAKYLLGSGNELKLGLQMLFEAGNYPSIHDLGHLFAIERQIDDIIRMLMDENESGLWPLIINSLWAWSTTHGMRKFLVKKGLLDAISPLSRNEIIFRLGIRDVVRLASGLLKSISHEPEHCSILLEKGVFLSCLTRYERPNARNVHTKHTYPRNHSKLSARSCNQTWTLKAS